MDIPVYLVAGFLDSGKTSFINGILEDGFAREDRTLLICCEEGDEEYEKKALDNVTVVTVDDEEELTLAFCKELEKSTAPSRCSSSTTACGRWKSSTARCCPPTGCSTRS